MKKSILVGGILGLVVAATVSAYFLKKKNYELVKPHRGEIIEAIYGLGKVKTNSRFEVKLGVIGTIQKVYVKEGQLVKRGDRLLDIENGIGFKSPMAGVVTLVQNFAGETALPQQALMRVEDLADLYIEVSLEQEGALRVRAGQNAKIVFESLRNVSLEGQVTALFPKDDEFLAHIEVKDLAENILPGMTADVSIEIGKIEDALLIPLLSVTNGVVSVQRDGKKMKNKVEIGHVDGMWAEVKSGVETNDEVMVPGSKK